VAVVTTSQDSRRRSNGSSSNGSGSSAARRISAGAAARRAREEFPEVSDIPVERVSAVDRTDKGWQVTLEALELRRVPETMDVIGVYEVDLNARGQVSGWRRVARFHRSQVQER
jgi:hypothetical protein